MGRALVGRHTAKRLGLWPEKALRQKQEKQLTNPALCKWENVKRLSSMFSKSLDF
jgi:hypothetical protein